MSELTFSYDHFNNHKFMIFNYLPTYQQFIC